MPVLGELVENLWLRCGPTLSFVVPDYVLLLKGTDHHKMALEALHRGDRRAAEKAVVSDIQDASRYLESLACDDGIIRAPRSSAPSIARLRK
jgi:DNA-binding GntR family transcriptional regulator